MTFQTLNDLDLNGKRVLLRVDLNVPVRDGVVTDTTRIDRLKPTIEVLRDKNAKIILLSHFGRPKGQRNQDYSLSFLPPFLEESWGIKVGFADDCIGNNAAEAVNQMSSGDCVLLENVRFHEGEEANDTSFAKALSENGDIYVNDAFSAAHRAHASTQAITQFLPSAAGLLMESELNALSKALESPARPVMAVVGGAKISTKLGVLHNIVKKSDYLCLGGGMANTFLYAKGYDLGGSLCEKDMKDEALAIMKEAKTHNCQILLPVDLVCVEALSENAPSKIYNPAGGLPEEMIAVDAGDETIKTLKSKLDECKTILWNGPLGVFEIKPFDKATNALASHAAHKTKSGDLVSVAGGGDTVAALENAGAADDFTYISTAGGAFLEWLEGKTLPGVAALMNKAKAA